MNSLRSALTAALTSQRGNEEVEAEIRSGTPDRPSLQTCCREYVQIAELNIAGQPSGTI
jgi:hypothetical protein